MQQHWEPAIEVYKPLGLSQAIFGATLKRKPETPWLRKKGRSIEVDTGNPEYKHWLAKALENSKRRKGELSRKKERSSTSVQKKIQPDQNPINESVPSQSSTQPPEPSPEYDPEYLALEKRSNEARLLEPIKKNEEKDLNIQRKKTLLMREAGDLVEAASASFLWIGYMEKTNLEILRAPKKIQPIIENLIKDEIIRCTEVLLIENETERKLIMDLLQKIPAREVSLKITNNLTRECEQVLRDVKANQRKDMIEHKKSLEIKTIVNEDDE